MSWKTVSNPARSNFVIYIAILFALTACGDTSAQENLSEKLPNQNVPLDVMPGQPIPAPGENQPGRQNPFSNEPATSAGQAPSVSAQAPKHFKLAETAMILGLADDETYDSFQKKWLGTDYPACNFFLTTALCEAGYCKTSKPLFIAAEFDIYLMSVGFVETSLPVVKDLFLQAKKFDLVFQKDNPVAGAPGHVMVGVGYNPNQDRVIIAQGSLGTVSHEVKSVPDSHILNWQGGFKIFVRR